MERAKWVGKDKIRLRFDPFAYRYIRLKILARDQYTCYWCGGPGDTIDHVIPWSKGGRTTMNNCICACSACNGERGDTPAGEFALTKRVEPPREGLLPIPAAERINGSAPRPVAAVSRDKETATPERRPSLAVRTGHRLLYQLLDPALPAVHPSTLR